ncbi:host cell division inhibitor Icd-like protein [Klebsiella pneumoniae]|uniref:host cell division inhibitor Icd-like protein n=1 Tax=Klebsiella pneumoniae TaxID=573 RepID=UPI001090D4B0|nr:host cell division inhibitor Icd-like protein [Klebsiella pneumoniae]
MIAVQRKSFSLAGLSVDISCNSSVMDNKFLSFSFGVKRDPTVAGFSTSTLATSTRTREGEFCASIKKGLPTIANPVYGYSAPAKSGAGIGVLQLSTAHNRAKCGFFVCAARLHPSMVGWARASKDAPVSVEAGTPTSFSSPPVIGVFGGDFKHHSTEAAAMLATTPTQYPQFIWLIAAVRRDMPTITAKIHHIAAESEREARRTLSRDHVCFFAGRIRLEVAA